LETLIIPSPVGLNVGPRHRPGVKTISGPVGLNVIDVVKIIPGPVGLNVTDVVKIILSPVSLNVTDVVKIILGPVDLNVGREINVERSHPKPSSSRARSA
jgi:hypothetical protein